MVKNFVLGAMLCKGKHRTAPRTDRYPLSKRKGTKTS